MGVAIEREGQIIGICIFDPLFLNLPHDLRRRLSRGRQIKWTKESIHNNEKAIGNVRLLPLILQLVYVNSWDGVGGLPPGPDDPRQRLRLARSREVPIKMWHSL